MTRGTRQETYGLRETAGEIWLEGQRTDSLEIQVSDLCHDAHTEAERVT